VKLINIWVQNIKKGQKNKKTVCKEQEVVYKTFSVLIWPVFTTARLSSDFLCRSWPVDYSGQLRIWWAVANSKRELITSIGYATIATILNSEDSLKIIMHNLKGMGWKPFGKYPFGRRSRRYEESIKMDHMVIRCEDGCGWNCLMIVFNCILRC
jgi:hypothetical protein